MNDHALAEVLRRQYAAVARMLHNAVLACPDELWDRRADEAPLWQQAMHAIVATHMYLLDPPDGPEMAALWAKIRRDLDVATDGLSLSDLDRVRRANDVLTDASHQARAMLSKQAMLAYVADLSDASEAALATPERFDKPNAMTWSGPTVADRLVYNLRHAQHHIGRLHSILGRHGIQVPWVMGEQRHAGSARVC